MTANDDAAERRVVVGTWVSTVLYGRGRGIVYAIHSEQRPGTIRGPGAVAGDGRAHFDIIFLDGSRTELLPEAVLRGVQWSILAAPIAGAGEIAVALDHANQVEAQAKAEAAAAAEARAADLVRLRSSPDYAHLTQGDDQHSGKLAAANIRAELKQGFKGVKFSVRKTHHGSIQITWLDGPPEAAVDGAVSRYRRGRFDGMTDSYSDDRPAWCEVFGGAEYVFTRRELSDALIGRAIDALFVVRAADLHGIDKPTVADCRAGRLWYVPVDGLGQALQSLVLEQANDL
jgi:Large polyvalent protein associated domain 30/Large polyvalent protein associated domain 29